MAILDSKKEGDLLPQMGLDFKSRGNAVSGESLMQEQPRKVVLL